MGARYLIIVFISFLGVALTGCAQDATIVAEGNGFTDNKGQEAGAAIYDVSGKMVAMLNTNISDDEHAAFSLSFEHLPPNAEYQIHFFVRIENRPYACFMNNDKTDFEVNTGFYAYEKHVHVGKAGSVSNISVNQSDRNPLLCDHIHDVFMTHF